MSDKETFSFQQILNGWLKKEMDERKEKRVDAFHASSLGTCKKKQILRRMNTPESNPITERSLRIFSVGDVFHEWMQKKAEDAGVLIAKEQTITNEEYNYSGRYDALIEQDGIKLLYDFKTQHSKSFHYIQENGIGVEDSKKMQIVSYAVMGKLDVKECRLLFISKDDLCLMEVPVKVEDYKDKVIEELKELNEYYKNKKIPNPISEVEKGKPNWQCSYCPYLDKCRGKGWAEKVKNKIKKEKKDGRNKP